MSFVKIGHHTPEEGRTSSEEAGPIISGHVNIPSFGQAPIQGLSFAKLGLRNSSSLRLSTSSGKRSGNDPMQLPKHNENNSHHEVIKLQGIFPTNLGSLGSLPTHADHLHERGVQRRSSSPLSDSSEEIIVFSGRKRSKNETLNSTNRALSCEGNSEDIPGFIESTKLNSLVDHPSMKYEPTSNPSRSTSPGGASLEATSFMKRCADVVERRRAISDDPNHTGLLRSKKTQKYEVLASYAGDTDKIDGDDSSAIDQFSDLSDVISTDSMEYKFSPRGDMAHVEESSRNEKRRDPDLRLVLKKKGPPSLTVSSTQVSNPSLHSTKATESVLC